MPKPSPKDRGKAEEFFRDRVPLTGDEGRMLDDRSRRQAFWLAQVGDLRVADMVLKSLRRAIEFGEDLDDWKRKIGGALRAAWGPGSRNRAGRVFNQGRRLSLIFRNATQTASNGSRFRRLRQQNVMAIRPFWEFVAVRPTEHPSEVCTELNGMVRPANDPIWNTRQPPLHHDCQSSIKALTAAEARRRGLTEQVPDILPDAGFGEVPTEATTALTTVDLGAIDQELARLFQTKTRRGPQV